MRSLAGGLVASAALLILVLCVRLVGPTYSFLDVFMLPVPR